MFDNKKLGAYIQFLRKSKGMTQSRLAEALGLSPQAISNWERGESMPDIALLQQIARVLGTTVDRMLSAAEDFNEERYKVLSEEERQDETAGKEEESPQRGEFNFDLGGLGTLIGDTVSGALSGLSGLSDDLKPKLENIREEIEKAVSEAGHELEDAMKTSRNADHVIVHVKSKKTDTNDKWKDIVAMAPFASEETLNRLVRDLDPGSDLKKIVSLAPFLSNETVDELLTKAIDSDADINWDFLKGIAPFCHNLDSILLKCNKPFTIKQLVPIAPFLSENTVDELIKKQFEQ